MTTALLLDIEGTTTPLAFVMEVLFPFARQRMAAFLARAGQEPEVQADLAQLRQEYESDRAAATPDLPPWKGSDPGAAVPYLQYLMACDRKSTGLKALQGKVWALGYHSGALQSQLFADVPTAFQRWTAAGKALYIFSSGSIQAQQLLFAHTPMGDLTPYLQGYFDTTTGSKREVASYQAIAAAMGHAPAAIVFISDVVAELQAAQAAGFQVYFCHRPGNASGDNQGFPTLTTFAGFDP